MMKLLLDTSVWLDLAKDYRQKPLIRALDQLLDEKKIQIVLPKLVLEEFERNIDRISTENKKSLGSHFKKVSEAINEFAKDDSYMGLLEELHEVEFRIKASGETSPQLISYLEEIFAKSVIVETSEKVKLRAADRALKKEAPLHRNKNSVADAVLIEIFAELDKSDLAETFAFVTHNKQDFSNIGIDERMPHPDIANHFTQPNCIYALRLSQLIDEIAPELMENFVWEFEYQSEYRTVYEIYEEIDRLIHQRWYDRHQMRKSSIENGRVKVLSAEEYDDVNHPTDQILESIWLGALEAEKRVEEEIGKENLGPWTDYEWGMLSGKLSALRWVLGFEWDFLDT